MTHPNLLIRRYCEERSDAALQSGANPRPTAARPAFAK